MGEAVTQQPVAVFFFRPTLGGGTTTFTAHLMAALSAAGASPRLYRVGHESERVKNSWPLREFGQYNLKIETINLSDARHVVRTMPSVLAAPANPKFLIRPDLLMYLAKNGMRCVVHDPKEFSAYSGKPWTPPKFPQPPICIRPTLRDYVPDAVYIRHPYRRSLSSLEAGQQGSRTKIAISTARVHSSKRPRLLIEANVMLPKRLRIEMLGTEYRMYSYGLAKKFPGVYAQKSGVFAYPLTFDAPVDVNMKAQYNFDMSWFETDGGGSQYCQLEAMDAGTTPVMHRDWFRYKGSMREGVNALSVSSPMDIVNLIASHKSDYATERRACIRAANLAFLEHHNPARIGRQYMKELMR